MKSGLAAFCAAVAAAVALSAVPAGAQTTDRLTTCNNEWNAMKSAGSVGEKKYADFRKECMARLDSSEVAPAAPGRPVLPAALSSKYANESAREARKHTCLDQYSANKTAGGNGGLYWIQKGGGYYSECMKRLTCRWRRCF